MIVKDQVVGGIILNRGKNIKVYDYSYIFESCIRKIVKRKYIRY